MQYVPDDRENPIKLTVTSTFLEQKTTNENSTIVFFWGFFLVWNLFFRLCIFTRIYILEYGSINNYTFMIYIYINMPTLHYLSIYIYIYIVSVFCVCLCT